MMKRRRKWDNDRCPRCQQPEDAAHVWKCQQTEATELFKAAVDKVREWLREQHTFPPLIDAICDNIWAWRQGNPTTPSMALPAEVREIVEYQTRVGWQAFFEGTPVQGWADIQQRYYEFIRSRRLGRRWIAAVIRKMWDIAWDLWEHRNQVLHDRENSLLSTSTNQHIREELRLGVRTLTAAARAVFQANRGSILAAPLDVRVAWVARIQTARARFTREQEEGVSQYRQQREMLRRWLTQQRRSSAADGSSGRAPHR
jgi:hypothetical protein